MEEATNNNSFGILSSAPDNTIINKIYDYLSYILFSFRGENDENENAITNRLCKNLNYQKPPEYPFFFHHQNLENDKENTSTDFAVFGTFAYGQENNIESHNPSSLIKFEAKRLHSKQPKQREKEYVCGEYINGICSKNSGGIERFKNGRHGKDVLNAGIIGYIQSDSPKHWLQKVNFWVNEQIQSASDSKLIWQKSDLLVLDSQDSILSCYFSVSRRIYGDDINLRHFWVNLSNE